MKLSTLSTIIAAPLTGFFMSVADASAQQSPEDMAKLQSFTTCLQDELSKITIQMPSDEQLKEIGMTEEQAFEMLKNDAATDSGEECAKKLGIGFERTPNEAAPFKIYIGNAIV